MKLLGVRPSSGLAAAGGLAWQTESSVWGEFWATFSFAKHHAIVNAKGFGSRRKSFSLDSTLLLHLKMMDYRTWDREDSSQRKQHLHCSGVKLVLGASVYNPPTNPITPSRQTSVTTGGCGQMAGCILARETPPGVKASVGRFHSLLWPMCWELQRMPGSKFFLLQRDGSNPSSQISVNPGPSLSERD